MKQKLNENSVTSCGSTAISGCTATPLAYGHDFDRALIIKGCWLDCIFDNSKTWEMRSTSTKRRGKVGLIQSGTGLIVGETNIVGVLGPLPSVRLEVHKDKHQCDLSILDKWRYAWVLEDAKRYDVPIHYVHPKGAVVWVKV